MADIIIHSVIEYLQLLQEWRIRFQNWNNENFNQEYMFFSRGQAKQYDPTIIPSIYYKEQLLVEEAKMMKETMARFPDTFADKHFFIEKLILMQHYDVPTRLLDISSNPLVALFFASSSGNDGLHGGENGIIEYFIIPSRDIRYIDSYKVTALANCAKIPMEYTSYKKDLPIDDFRQQGTITYLHEEMLNDYPSFKNDLTPDMIDNVLCVRPYQNNPRIIRQNGYFLLFGFQEKEKKASSIELKFHNEKEPELNWFHNRISVDAASKPNMLQELANIGLDKSFFYTDISKFGEEVKALHIRFDTH